MRAYELMVILSGALDDNAAHSWLGTVTKSIQSVGGSVHGSPDWWGRRRLAYPIAKQHDGYYAVFNVLAEGGALDEVERRRDHLVAAGRARAAAHTARASGEDLLAAYRALGAR